MPSVTVLSTGGTIASTAGERGATPEKSGADLVRAVPDLDAHADIEVRDVLETPSFDIGLEGMATIARAAIDAANESADGVVVTHGTDTMEESAYYLDLVCDLDIPVMFTGAQRRPDEVSPDGPANLLTAVRATTHEYFADAGGVFVAFDEEIHAARDVTKTHTSALDTFRSPDGGPVARFSHAKLLPYREPGSRSASFDVTETTNEVAMIKSGAGVSGTLCRAAIDAEVDGIIVEGTGLGNTTGEIESAVADAISEGIPVVITSRCLGGAVAPVYGGPGGGETLRSHGVIDGGDLSAQKAQLKLTLALEAADDDDVEVIKERFETQN